MSDRYRVIGNVKMAVGLGFGDYATVDSLRDTPAGTVHPPFLAGVVSPLVNADLTDHCFVRFIWDRIITNYSEDSDVWLVGFGYRFR
jgi:hypothetical protein